jgi:hypothetical protein
MPKGVTTIDFGSSYPGSTYASVDVPGQTDILSGSFVEAFVMASTTSDHTDANHIVAASLMTLTCGNIVPGASFTVYAICEQQLMGQFTIEWVWS